jgi:hypothetical protein
MERYNPSVKSCTSCIGELSYDYPWGAQKPEFGSGREKHDSLIQSHNRGPRKHPHDENVQPFGKAGVSVRRSGPVLLFTDSEAVASKATNRLIHFFANWVARPESAVPLIKPLRLQLHGGRLRKFRCCDACAR